MFPSTSPLHLDILAGAASTVYPGSNANAQLHDACVKPHTLEGNAPATTERLLPPHTPHPTRHRRVTREPHRFARHMQPRATATHSLPLSPHCVRQHGVRNVTQKEKNPAHSDTNLFHLTASEGHCASSCSISFSYIALHGTSSLCFTSVPT